MSITAGSIAFFISDVFSWQDAQIIVPTGWTIYIGKKSNTVICWNKTPPLADDFVRKGVLFPHFFLFHGLSVLGQIS